MGASLSSEVARRVGQVRRRLWLAEFVPCLLASWAVSLLGVCVYFAVHSALWGRASDAQGWTAFGLAAAASVGLGLIWAWKRAPGTVAAALAIDEKFALKERVATYFSLTPEQRESPIGQALLEDVHGKLTALSLAGRFPVRLRWPQLLRPVLAGTLGLLAFLFFPRIEFSSAVAPPDETAQANAEAARKRLEEIKKEAAADKQDVPRSGKEKEINDLIDKLLEKDLSQEKQFRESLDQLTALEDKVQDRVNELMDQGLKNRKALNALENLKLPTRAGKEKFPEGPGKELEDALKKAGEELDRLARERMQEGLGKEFEEALNNGDLEKAKDEIERLAKKLRDADPAAAFEDALARGDMKKAAAEIDRLQKKLQNNEFNQRELAQLLERFEELQRQLHRLHDQADLREELARELQKEVAAGNLTEKEMQERLEQLDRELAGLKEELVDLKELADLLDEYQKALRDKAEGKEDGDGLKGKFAKLLGKLEKLGKQDGAGGELDRLRNRQAQMEAARLALLRGLRPGGNGNGNAPGPGGTGKGSGARPPGVEPTDATAKNQRIKTDADLKKLRITGYGSGGGFSKIPAKEVGGSFQRANQEAAEASQVQRIPADLANVSRGYFQKLGAQK